MPSVYVPAKWDQTAVDVLAQKYLRHHSVNRNHENSLRNSKYSASWARNDEFNAAIPNEEDREIDSREAFHRMIGCWTSWGEKLGYFTTAADAQAFYDELSYMVGAQIFAPNSPQWFNTGVSWAYGYTGRPQGHWHVDPATGNLELSPDSYTYPASSACFIQSIDDNLVEEGGIMDTWVREARIFKYGGGSGINFSNLRAKNEPLSTQGVSSGVMSFLKVGDVAAGSIKSGGISRRAAKLVVLDADHPDILEFINWKVKEEHKVVALAAGSKQMIQAWKDLIAAKGNEAETKKTLKRAKKAGVPMPFLNQCIQRIAQNDLVLDLQDFDLTWDHEAYHTVSAMNANNSVRVTDAFMEAVIADQDWTLRGRSDPNFTKVVKAKDLFHAISRAAWFCADPGLQFHDTINNWHTGAVSAPILAANPCAEYNYIDDSACNLASVNLVTMLKADGTFDIDAYVHANRLVTIALEITVAMSQYPTKNIAWNSYTHRTLGLGYANLGSLLMRSGLPYDSVAGRAYAAGLTAIMTAVSYKTSAEMAQELDPCIAWEPNKEPALRVLRNHRNAAYGLHVDQLEKLNPKVEVHGLSAASFNGRFGYVLNSARKLWDEVVDMATKYGLRNMQTTLLAPTGTIGLVMSCDTTGVEPDFALIKFKKLAGGGYFKLVNGAVPEALQTLGYKESEIEDIIDYVFGKSIMKDHTDGIKKTDLIAAGYTEEVLTNWDTDLKTAFDPSYVLPLEELKAKFGAERTEKFLLDVGGRGTLEGAPRLKSEHLAVFDCAVKCGKLGSRAIRPEGHLRMMAEIQPFLSGAISKTVNMAADATIEDIENVYFQSWQLGLKAVAVYRDGSKMSQPLSTSMALLDGIDDVLEDEDASQDKKVDALATGLVRAIRTKLPQRRGGYTQAVNVGGNKLYLRTGEYADGTLGEIFLDTHKEGAAFRSLLNCFAISISIGLQYGVPLEEYCDAFLFTKFEPHGSVQGHDFVKRCTSMIDFIFRDLAITYLGRNELAHVDPDEMATITQAHPACCATLSPVPTIKSFTATNRSAVEIAKEHGFTGDMCPECGHFKMVRNGVCLKCTECGTTTGCS
jgi:ribonucleoside-diphosphate reductase alpha chain